MDHARWERIQAIFHEIVDQPAHLRPSLLKAAAGGDEQLIAEVQSLLDEDARASPVLDQGVAQVAGRMLGPGAFLPSQEFGPYKLREVLGEGGMGVVYLAEREDLGSRVAIKVLRDAWMSPARRERFASEQRTLAQLTHPNIARLYDADTLSDGTPWFAMEYVKGLPLTDYCRQRESSIEECLTLFRSVCEAVQYAHSHAVIHRDLKPSNILVQADGSVKLLDFGIAKQIDREDASVNRTRTGLWLMTPTYAAPEQIRGEPVGIYADVYALGVILYELLAGRPPFDLSNRTPGEAQAMIEEQEPEKPSVLAGGKIEEERGWQTSKASWADLDVLVLTSMHKDPKRRYPSVEALIRDIDRYLAGQPLEARPDTVLYRAGKFVRRNQRTVTAAALVLAIVAGLVVFYTWRLAAARNAALKEAARSQRILRFTLNLFQGGDNAAGPASDLRVAALIDRGILEAKNLDQEPEVQAELYETLGEVCQKLGELDRADSLLSAALDRRRSLHGAEAASVGHGMVKLGLLRASQAKLEEAERLVREGLEIIQRRLPADHPEVAAATHALGKVLEDRGAYDQAIQVLRQAVRLRSGPGADKAALADSLLELANTHFYAGHYPESDSLNQTLLVMYRELYGERHPRIAEILINLGAIQQELGEYQQAEQFHRQALDLVQAFHGADHYKTASSLTLVARALVFQKRYDGAADFLERALAIQEKVFGAVHPRVASALNELGTVALMRERFDEAEAVYRRVVEIYRSVYAGEHYLIGIGLANLGSAYMARNEYVRAQALFREALGMFGQTLPANHLNVAITSIKLGRTLLRQDRAREAEGYSLAGYRILSAQANPSVSWLKAAREDLASIYRTLKQPEKAKEFLTEQPAPTTSPEAIPGRKQQH